MYMHFHIQRSQLIYLQDENTHTILQKYIYIFNILNIKHNAIILLVLSKKKITPNLEWYMKLVTNLKNLTRFINYSIC